MYCVLFECSLYPAVSPVYCSIGSFLGIFCAYVDDKAQPLRWNVFLPSNTIMTRSHRHNHYSCLVNEMLRSHCMRLFRYITSRETVTAFRYIISHKCQTMLSCQTTTFKTQESHTLAKKLVGESFQLLAKRLVGLISRREHETAKRQTIIGIKDKYTRSSGIGFSGARSSVVRPTTFHCSTAKITMVLLCILFGSLPHSLFLSPCLVSLSEGEYL